MTFDTHLPLNERLMRIDHIQARRYSKLNGVALEIATEGIVRHLESVRPNGRKSGNFGSARDH